MWCSDFIEKINTIDLCYHKHVFLNTSVYSLWEKNIGNGKLKKMSQAPFYVEMKIAIKSYDFLCVQIITVKIYDSIKILFT